MHKCSGVVIGKPVSDGRIGNLCPSETAFPMHNCTVVLIGNTVSDGGFYTEMRRKVSFRIRTPFMGEHRKRRFRYASVSYSLSESMFPMDDSSESQILMIVCTGSFIGNAYSDENI